MGKRLPIKGLLVPENPILRSPISDPQAASPALQVQRERLGIKRTSEANLTFDHDELRQGQIYFDGQGKTFRTLTELREIFYSALYVLQKIL